MKRFAERCITFQRYASCDTVYLMWYCIPHAVLLPSPCELFVNEDLLAGEGRGGNALVLDCIAIVLVCLNGDVKSAPIWCG